MLKQTLMSGLAALVTLWALSAAAVPITVQSILYDSDHNAMTVAPPMPDPPNGNPLQDGDFLIYRIDSAVDPIVGNGIDDRTRGIFDFRDDPNYVALSNVLAQTHGKVVGAQLSMVLTAKSGAFYNDQINLENGPFVGEPLIGNQLALNETKLVTINLLDFYSQEQLENFLSNGSGDYVNDGRIVLTYSDDAILTGAALRITADIPEPTTLALLTLGLLGIAMRARRS